MEIDTFNVENFFKKNYLSWLKFSLIVLSSIFFHGNKVEIFKMQEVEFTVKLHITLN